MSEYLENYQSVAKLPMSINSRDLCVKQQDLCVKGNRRREWRDRMKHSKTWMRRQRQREERIVGA